MTDITSAASTVDQLLFDPDALGSAPGTFTAGVGTDSKPPTMDQALMQKGDGGQAVQAYAKAHPGDLAKLEDRLLSQGRFQDIHQLAQQGRAPSATDPAPSYGGPVSQAKVDAFKAGDASAIAALQTQRSGLESAQAHLDVKAAHEITAGSAGSARALRTQIDSQLSKVDHELKLRAMTAAALKRSTAAEPGTDPAVAAPLAALPQGASSVLAKPLDTQALTKKVDALTTYDKPVHLSYPGYGGPGFVTRPKTDTTHSLATSPQLASAVTAGGLTSSEARVVGAMSPNEGDMDSVQAYDRAAVTAGAMQKTVNNGGTGELARQVHDFSVSHPADYQRLFADKGWTAAQTGKGTSNGEYTLSFKDPSDPKASSLMGQALSDYIKSPDPSHWSKTLNPLQDAGRDPTFQAQQVHDFGARLNEAVDATPSGYSAPISSYVTSEKGAALTLDQSVNTPANVPRTFGRALDGFYAANPKAARDPASWSPKQRAAYEPQIVQQYIAARDRTAMTDPAVRAASIMASPALSAAPGSFVRRSQP